tara:strand:+ start:257 stop:514 length:258 start_codon:yes stop_codon:yes gene_type:complete
MSKELTNEQKEELQKLIDELNNVAKDVFKDYESNPSELSGSVIQVSENSPFLDEKFEGEGWKNVVRGSVEEAISMIKNKKKNDTE